MCNKAFYFIVISGERLLTPSQNSLLPKEPEMQKKILIVDDYDDLSTALTEVFGKTGHSVKVIETRSEAVELIEHNDFDMIITDLDGENMTADDESEAESDCLPDAVNDSRSNVKAFKICVPNYGKKDFTEEDLKNFVETTLNYKAKFVDQKELVQNWHEKIEFEIPSFISLMHAVLNYLTKRVEKNGVVSSEDSHLFIALDEAFVNAVKHGNKFDSSKLVKISAEVSSKEARFTVEDEGEGFNINEIPDPTNVENLFKTSGRGVLIIHNVMDEVRYNERGNRVEMIKKSKN